jgi:hypothetical protein
MRMFVLASVIVVTAGCATPYQPFELFGLGGYQDHRISEDTYQVAYYGNHATPMTTLNSLLLYRSAELTLANGYDYFEVVKGYARRPLSSLGGFRTVEHTFKMYKGQPAPQASGRTSTYIARKVKEEFGPYVGQQFGGKLPKAEIPAVENLPVADNPVATARNVVSIDNVDAVPKLAERGRQGYRDWLKKPLPRAFVIAEDGSWNSTWTTNPQITTDPKDPTERAMVRCQRRSLTNCKIYAVDNRVVWALE